MSKQREALKMALLALEIAPLDHNSVKSGFFKKRHYAIIALREALAEPEPWTPDGMAYRPGGLPMDAEQEPVAWMCADEDMTRKGYSRFSRNCHGEWNIPVYTTPPARKPVGTVTGWYCGLPVIELMDGWIPAVGTVLYAAPPARKPLTDEEIDNLELPPNGCTMRELVRAIERAHKITE